MLTFVVEFGATKTNSKHTDISVCLSKTLLKGLIAMRSFLDSHPCQSCDAFLDWRVCTEYFCDKATGFMRAERI